jgi:hypothetical protein
MCKILIATAAALLTVPAMTIAQPVQQQQQQTVAKTENPDEIVCEKQEATGSRIATRRVCMTRSQWAEQRSADRMEIEKVQTQRGCTKNGC